MATGVERRMKCTLKLPLIPPRETPACPRPRPFPLPPPPSSAPGAASGPPAIDKSRRPAVSPLLSNEDNIDPADTIKLRLLGHGSSGKVYKVQHKHTGKIYALKVIQEKNWENQILTTEMCILRRANSPHVIRCHGCSLSDKNGDISFVLEYMDGGSLATVLETHGTINEHYLGEVASQVLRGLNYLHSNKIVHRDIKPSNLLINQRQEVKIADFGVSSVLDSSLAPCNSFVGTCAYMSPERFDPDSHGGNYCGYAADIWSLGLTLLECAIGHYPYLGPGQNADWPTLMVGICYGEPPSPPPGASPLFRDFIMRCLQKDPIRRPRASVLLSHPFVARYENSPCDISGLLRSPSL